VAGLLGEALAVAPDPAATLVRLVEDLDAAEIAQLRVARDAAAERESRSECHDVAAAAGRLRGRGSRRRDRPAQERLLARRTTLITVASAARKGTAAQLSSSPPDFPGRGRQVKGTLRASLRDRHSPILDRHPLNG
jgi:hypothetical protein